MIEEDTYSIVTDKIPEGKTRSSRFLLAAWRGIPTWPRRCAVLKIALGHDRDDILQTLF
jgi:tRNA 2-thiocytidine biosynthesis protein TtcA